MARQCLVVAIMHQPGVESSSSTEGGSQQSKIPVLSMNVLSKGVECEKLKEIVVDGDLEKFFQVETQLPPREKEELIMFLKRNIGVFAWNAYETPEVNPDFICHHLNANPAVCPKK